MARASGGNGIYSISLKAWGYFGGADSARGFCEKLAMNGCSAQKFLSRSLLAGFIGSMALTVLLFSAKTEFFYITAGALGFFLFAFLFNFLLQDYFFERNKKAREQMAPDMLLQASAFPKGTPFDKIIGYIAGDDFGLLGAEFKKAQEEIGRGASFTQAMQRLRERNSSAVIDRAVLLLQQGYESGADMSGIFREAAGDILETNAILQERNASLLIEKYTLLFAGGLIVPTVLGMLAGMVSGFDFSSFGQLIDFAGSAGQRGALLQSVLLANKIYIVEYALIASFFVASQEAHGKKAVIYASFLLPCSLLAYFIASGFRV